MQPNNLNELFCAQCSLQFGGKTVYNLHLSLVHNVKEDGQNFQSRLNKIKSENIELKHIGGNIKRNIKEKQSFKFEICERKFSFRFSLKRHMNEVHEEKRTHKCEICDYTSFIKAKMDNHMESVHERKKKF